MHNYVNDDRRIREQREEAKRQAMLSVCDFVVADNATPPAVLLVDMDGVAVAAFPTAGRAQTDAIVAACEAGVAAARARQVGQVFRGTIPAATDAGYIEGTAEHQAFFLMMYASLPDGFAVEADTGIITSLGSAPLAEMAVNDPNEEDNDHG